jgi:hypothetical protein
MSSDATVVSHAADRLAKAIVVATKSPALPLECAWRNTKRAAYSANNSDTASTSTATASRRAAACAASSQPPESGTVPDSSRIGARAMYLIVDGGMSARK